MLGAPCSSLIIHPTSLSLRQLQRRQLETTSFFDSRGHITFSSLQRDCATATLAFATHSSRFTLHASLPPAPSPHLTSHASHLTSHVPRPPTDLDRELAIVETVIHFRSTHSSKSKILSALAPSALEETLAQLISIIAPLANRTPDFLTLLANDTQTPKNPELAALYSTYIDVCQSLNVADDASLNAAILALIAGPREYWPLSLRQATTVTFKAIRWITPFQESFIHALTARLGKDNVIIEHILADYEQDWWGGTLISGAGRLLFGDPQSAAADCQYHSSATRAAIEGLTSLREGYAMQDPALAEKARACVGFSCSVGSYGEIEDLARRIAWELHDRPDPLRPEDICLVTRNLGAASDAIMDVFSRFNIPYYFRRGVPVLSVPIVKTFINLARFSATRERDLFCSLLQSPWMSWNLSPSSPEPLNTEPACSACGAATAGRPCPPSPASGGNANPSSRPSRLLFNTLSSSPIPPEPRTLNPALPFSTPIHNSSFIIHTSPPPPEPRTLNPAPPLSPLQLADDILRSGVEPVIDDPDRFARRLTNYVMEKRRFPDRPSAEAYAAQAVQAYRSVLSTTNITTFNAALADLQTRADSLFTLKVSLPPPIPNSNRSGSHLNIQHLNSPPSSLVTHHTSLPPSPEPLPHALHLNSAAWETVTNTLSSLRRHTLINRDTDTPITWIDVVDLLNRALENITVSATRPDESGVWILNPFDVAGLQFKVVLVSGLNAGAFPKSPTPSPLFPDAELQSFREKLQAKHLGAPRSALPASALAASKARNSQENLLFLTTLAAARERIVFSYSAHDETGQDLPPSVFFSTLWRLVGWPAYETLPPAPPDPYDQWRLQKEPAHLQSHWQQKTPGKDAFKRRPFPGESYLGTIPLPLCRANDERHQRLAAHPPPLPPEPRTLNPEPSPPPSHVSRLTSHVSPPPSDSSFILHTSSFSPPSPSSLVTHHSSLLPNHIPHAIHVERQRQAFFNNQNQTAPDSTSPPDTSALPGHEYAGVLDASLWTSIRASLNSGIQDFSPTQLERLVACPYQYYLHHILRAEPIEPNDLEPRAEDLGTAIHAIIHTGFRLLQGLPPPDNSSFILHTSSFTSSRLSIPTWAVRDQHHVWHLQESPDKPSPEAIPLVAFRPGADTELLSFFDSLAETMLDWHTRGNAIWRLGAPEQLNLQRLRIRRSIRNLVRTALNPDAFPDIEGLSPSQRYPALLEYIFDSRPDHNADGTSIELTDPANPAHKIRLHGKIDRVDLVFDADKILRAVIVVDYKGKSKAKLTLKDLAAGISTATDCQLPTYALAAAQALCMPPEPRTLNPEPSSPSSLVTHYSSPLLMHYLSYTESADDMAKQCKKKAITLDGTPLDPDDLSEILGIHASLADAFVTSIFAALNRYERGDFAVAPEKCDYCDFKACCRHSASLLSPESTNGGDNS